MSTHRRHRHSSGYRIRRWFRHNKRLAVYGSLLSLAVIGVGIVFVFHAQKEQKNRHVTAGNSVNVGSGYRNITYKGKHYQYNNLITNILYAGIDSTGKMEPTARFGDQARADSISLVVMDKKHKKMTIIAISRDTMTDIHRYTLDGTDRGAGESHLGFAYTYGEGGTVSCENLVWSVSNLLYNIPIQEYVVTNQTSMPYINNLVGGVTVTVPNDDLAQKYPELTSGAVVTLDDSTVTDYLHFRDTSVDFSNEGRIARQKSFINAFIPLAKTKTQTDINGMWEKLEAMEDYLQTSITKNKYIDLVNLMDQITYTDEDFYSLPGENRAGELHDEFYPDMGAIQDKVIELFYEEVS